MILTTDLSVISTIYLLFCWCWRGYNLLLKSGTFYSPAFKDLFFHCMYFFCSRYIYVPLGGSRHGRLHKMLSTGLAFGFVCLWHGGHDYLQYWALMNWAGVLVENGLKSLFASSCIHSIVVSLKSQHSPLSVQKH